MTGDEIIALARANFGEESALTVSETTALDYLNAALREVYDDLPPDRLKPAASTSAVALVSGKGTIDDSYDKIIEVHVDGVPGLQVPKDVIAQWDYGTLFQSVIPVYYVDSENLWVRPTTSTAEVVYLQPPTEVTSGTSANEVAEVPEVFHSAVADLMASYMYAQEEDTQQATQYREQYMMKIGNPVGVPQEVEQ